MKRNALLTILVFCFIFTSCSSYKMRKTDQAPNFNADPKGSILIIARAVLYAMAAPITNYIDGKAIGQTRGQTYFITKVDPGIHYLIAQGDNTEVIKMDFKQGRLYLLEQYVYSNFFSGQRTGYVPMIRKDLEWFLQKCDYVEYDHSDPIPDLDAAALDKVKREAETKMKEDPAAYQQFLGYEGFVY
jgi:hypothetical protein